MIEAAAVGDLGVLCSFYLYLHFLLTNCSMLYCTKSSWIQIGNEAVDTAVEGTTQPIQ
jgi:hypothetical protein